MTYVKVNHKFWSTLPNRALTVTVSAGPWAGLKVAPQAAQEYEDRLERFRSALAGREPGRLLCVGGTTWYYLAAPEMTIGAYSAWLSGAGAATVDRLRSYYELNPGHLPDYIYVPPEANWDAQAFQARILDPYGFTPVEIEGAMLYVRQAALAQ